MTCTESTQIDLSALLDGEYDPDELLQLIDQLVESEDCREFYRSSRRLERAVSSVAPGRFSLRLPEKVWQSIRKRSGLVPSLRSRVLRMPRLVPTWAVGVAAVALMALALWDTEPTTDPAQSGRIRPGVRIELEVGEDPDHMSDERFVTLMAELLRADSRYHRKMLEVMSEVDRFGFEAEGSTEGRFTTSEGSRGEGTRPDAGMISP